MKCLNYGTNSPLGAGQSLQSKSQEVALKVQSELPMGNTADVTSTVLGDVSWMASTYCRDLSGRILERREASQRVLGICP